MLHQETTAKWDYYNKLNENFGLATQKFAGSIKKNF